MLSARARISRPRDFTPPRTHVFIRVELDGESWLADVGVGGLSASAAIRLVADVPQPTPHEERRLVHESGVWFHQARLGETWADVCEFTLEEMPRIDWEVANWFTSAHPRSHFRDTLMAALALPDGGRVTLQDRELTVRTRASVEKRRLGSPEELVEVLRSRFGLVLPEGTTFVTPGLDWST